MYFLFTDFELQSHCSKDAAGVADAEGIGAAVHKLIHCLILGLQNRGKDYCQKCYQFSHVDMVLFSECYLVHQYVSQTGHIPVAVPDAHHDAVTGDQLWFFGNVGATLVTVKNCRLSQRNVPICRSSSYFCSVPIAVVFCRSCF